jgi:DHA1 family tetracycline resistance protein-like MFS transporter
MTIFAIVFIDLLGFGIVIPLLPLYAERYHPSALEFGLLLSSFSAMQFLFAPVLGRLSDRFGRKPVLLVSLAGSVAGYVLFAFAGSLAALFVARIIDGISGGNISTAQAYVADVTTPADRAKGMGVVGAAFGLGFIFGPAIAGVTVLWGPAAPGLAAAAMSACALVATALFLREPERPSKAFSQARSRGIFQAIRDVRVLLVLVVFFLVTFAFSNFEATFSQFLHDTLGAAPAAVAFVFVYIGVLISFVQGGAIRPLSKRFGERPLAVGGIALVALGLFLMPFSTTRGILLVVLVPLTLGIGAANPSLSSFVSKLAGEDERGTVLGAYQSMSSLGRILGPLWGEFVYFRLGPRGPQWTGAFVAASAGILALWAVAKDAKG